jgi:hypothetical protein
MRVDEKYTVHVLEAEGRLLASFADAADALRFAALIYEPGAEPLLRRASDGSVRPFSPISPTRSLLSWACVKAAESNPARVRAGL